MLLTEYDEAKQMELFRLDGIEEGKEIGREEGEARGAIKGVIKLYNDELGLTPTQIIQKIMDRFDLEKEEAEKYVEETLDLQMA